MKIEFQKRYTHKMKNENKILIILPTDSIGGAERVMKNITSYFLTNEGKQVDVVFMSRGDNGNWSDLNIFKNFSPTYIKAKSEFLSLLPTFLYLLKNRSKYSLVISTHTHVNAFLSLLRGIRVIRCDKLVLRESTVIFDRFFGWKRFTFKLLYRFYYKYDLIVLQTDYMKCRLIEEVPFLEKNRLKVIRNPLYIKNIDDSLTNFSQCNKKTSFELVFVGRLIPVKNVSLIFNALSNIKGIINDITIKIVGDGSEKDTLKKLAINLGISQQVQFIGNVNNPYIHMKNADIGIISSTKEGFPNVIIEMMAAGTKNIITTPCAGDLDKLPEITVLDDFEASTLSSSILEKYYEKKDCRKIYRKYAESIDVEVFVGQLI